jgi:hypothetical protein
MVARQTKANLAAAALAIAAAVSQIPNAAASRAPEQMFVPAWTDREARNAPDAYNAVRTDHAKSLVIAALKAAKCGGQETEPAMSAGRKVVSCPTVRRAPDTSNVISQDRSNFHPYVRLPHFHHHMDMPHIPPPRIK